MSTIAILVFLVLAAIAALHLAWGLGVRWPLTDEADLTRLVVGQTGRTEMPGFALCLAAAAGIGGAGVIALVAAGVVPIPLPAALVTLAIVAVAAVFLGRGIATYTPLWREHFSEEPFATMDRNWYGPFCLVLGAACAAIAVQRLT